jgi:predicted nucleic acid-binding protein
MAVVIDANIGLAQAISLPYSEKASAYLKQWRSDGVRVVVPTLWWYEFLTGIRRAVFLGLLTHDQSLEILEQIVMMDWKEVSPDPSLNRSTLIWAELIDQSKAYDAHYLAVAEQVRAEFWTADERLYNRVRQLGISWVRWIMKPDEV